MRKVLCEWNQEEIDELATETCECVNARIYTHKKSQKERAHNKIDLLFGENNTTVIVPDAAVDLLHKTVYPICEGFIQSATVDMGNGIKGKISITTKGIVKVTRTKTNNLISISEATHSMISKAYKDEIKKAQMQQTLRECISEYKKRLAG